MKHLEVELHFPSVVYGSNNISPDYICHALTQLIFPNFVISLIGGVIGYLIIWLIIFLYKKIRNKEGMGLGDAKLLSAIGFWFGWISIPIIIFFSSVIALLTVAPSLINKSRNLSTQIPFGPYLIIGCVIFIIFGNQVILILFNI